MKQRQQPYNSNRSAVGPRRRSWWQRPALRFGLFAAGLTVLLVFVLRRASDAAGLSAVDRWLIVINVVTFGIYSYDKTIAASAWTRVPERVLLLLALIGGTIGALTAMLLLRHKTAKASFRLKLLLVILAQIALIGLYYTVSGPQR